MVDALRAAIDLGLIGSLYYIIQDCNPSFDVRCSMLLRLNAWLTPKLLAIALTWSPTTIATDSSI
jgi:hypothetical protein